MSAAAILSLVILWEAKYVFETATQPPESYHELVKWAYVIARWGMAFVLGMMFPVTRQRVRRLIEAMVLIGFLTGLILIASYVTGRRDTSEWGMRYSPAARIAGLRIGMTCGFGAAAALGYFLLKLDQPKSGRRNLLLGGALGVMILACMLTGTRGPLVVLAAVTVVSLLLAGGRRAVNLAILMTVAGVLLYATVSLVPAAAMDRILGGSGGGGNAGLAEGVSTRMELIRRSLRVLEEAPFLGKTVGLITLMGIDYSHNMTMEFMVQLGLVGLTVYLMAMIPTMIRWLKAARRKGSFERQLAMPLVVIFLACWLERHSGGDISSEDVWVFAGILMGHSHVARGLPQAVGRYFVDDSGQWWVEEPAPAGALGGQLGTA